MAQMDGVCERLGRVIASEVETEEYGVRVRLAVMGPGPSGISLDLGLWQAAKLAEQLRAMVRQEAEALVALTEARPGDD